MELGRRIGALKGDCVAIDGSKFKAVNNRDKNCTKGQIASRLAHLEADVDRYITELGRGDRKKQPQRERRRSQSPVKSYCAMGAERWVTRWDYEHLVDAMRAHVGLGTPRQAKAPLRIPSHRTMVFAKSFHTASAHRKQTVRETVGQIGFTYVMVTDDHSVRPSCCWSKTESAQTGKGGTGQAALDFQSKRSYPAAHTDRRDQAQANNCTCQNNPVSSHHARFISNEPEKSITKNCLSLRSDP
jgi:hypothetical protein